MEKHGIVDSFEYLTEPLPTLSVNREIVLNQALIALNQVDTKRKAAYVRWCDET